MAARPFRRPRPSSSRRPPPRPRATLSGARAILPPNQTPNAFAHDAVGHGILGMCHIDGALGGGPQNSLMSAGPAVFSDQTALQPGAQRVDFVAAGLVDP